MAKRVDKKPAQDSAPDGADDLAILHPEHTLTVGGEKVTVREYGFVEGLRLRPKYQPLLDALYDIMVGERAPELDAVEAVLAEQLDTTLDLIAVAADVDRSFIEDLSNEDGQRLMDAWWAVNSPFFLRSVFKRAAQERALSRHAGATSTTASSSTGTTRTESGNTPSGKSSSTTQPPVAPKTGNEATPSER
ncbi:MULTISPECIES: DUF6631 family protein [unclassified Marinimicrobium]|jgi:hypothetical protein|uniref:DUF6631 family protein n=1 Tax=unclassified Marinimicrobium TaxID=2632100 RepID=UPI00257A34DC|nr:MULTISPECIES: DUF6631 family protein [unclassified Marinimicrobium]